MGMRTFTRVAVLCAGLSGCAIERDDVPQGEAQLPDEAPIHTTIAGTTTLALAPIATDEPGIYEMAVDSTHLYWVDNGQFDHEANVRRMPLAGGPIETLLSVPERVYSIAVAGGFVYAAHTTGGPDYAGHVYRIPTEGGTAVSIATGFNPTSVAVDGSWVYFSEAVSPGGRILRVPTSGGATEVVACDVDNPWDLEADDGVLFYSEMNRGRMMRVVPGADPTELASGWVATEWMTLDTTSVYFGASNSGVGASSLMRVDRLGGTPVNLSTGVSGAAKLWVGGDNIQWGSVAVPKTGGQGQDLGGTSNAFAAAATATDFYFADFYTGAIYRSSL